METKKMIDEKLTDKQGVTAQQEIIEILNQVEKHLKALVFYTTPGAALLPSAGQVSIAPPLAQKDGEDINEVIKQEIEKYLKENK